MEIGSKWNGWIVDSFIGEGSFGRVYKIKREELGYTYESALKVIRIPQSRTELTAVMNEGMSEESATAYFRSMVEDIVEEFALMSKLRGHSNIVSFEDHQIEELENDFGWEIFIRMELLTPLFDYLKGNTFTTRDVIRLGIDMCKALELCQKYNIIHRDIKPENIFLSEQGTYKLGDFGIARQLEKTTSGLSKKGTFTYMAPEVYKGEPYNSTVDIYSLGIVLYRFMNNNRTPFLPPYPEQIRFSDRENANVLRMSGQSLPEPCNSKGRLSEIILKACAYDPRKRYDSASELRRVLESLEHTEEMSKIIFPAVDLPGKTELTGSDQAAGMQDADHDNASHSSEDRIIEDSKDLTVSLFEHAPTERERETLKSVSDENVISDESEQSPEKKSCSGSDSNNEKGDHPDELDGTLIDDSSDKTTDTAPVEQPVKPGRRKTAFIAAAIVLILIIAAVGTGFMIGNSHKQNSKESADTKPKSDSAEQKPSSNEKGDEEDVYVRYEGNGISFALPEVDHENYNYISEDDDLFFNLSENSIDLEDGGLEDIWQAMVEYYNEQNEAKGRDEKVSSGEITIDGKKCYWIEYQRNDDWWTKTLYIPTENIDYFIQVMIDGPIENIIEMESLYDQLVDRMEFVGDVYEPTDSEIFRYGISFPVHNLVLESCGYDFYDGKAADNLYNVLFDFSSAEYYDNIDQLFDSDMQMLEVEKNNVEDSGELEIDGCPAKWYTYNETNESDVKGNYILLISNIDTGQIVKCYLTFRGKIDKHKNTVKEIIDQIHFID